MNESLYKTRVLFQEVVLIQDEEHSNVNVQSNEENTNSSTECQNVIVVDKNSEEVKIR